MLTPELLAKWRADPVEFAGALVMRRPDGTLGPPLLSPRQQTWLRALGERDDRGLPRYKTVGVVGPKRCGKTLLSAIGLVWKSLGEDRRSICLANSRESAESLGFDTVKELLARGPLAGTADVQRGRILWPAINTEILALPCNAATVAGVTVRGGLLVSDELWQATDPEPWRLLSSQCEGAEAQTLLVSQASGQDSDVYRLWQASQNGEPGLWFDYVNLEAEGPEGNPNPYITREFLAQRKAALPDALFRTYFLASWGSTENAFLAPDVLERCTLDYAAPRSYGEWGELVRRFAGDGLFCVTAGLDRAQPFAGQDESAFVVLAGMQRPLEPWHFYGVRSVRMLTGAEAEVLGAVAEAQEVFGSNIAMVFETYQSADIAARVGAELRAASTQAQVSMFSFLSRLAVEGRLHLPADPEFDLMRKQLAGFMVDTTGPQPRFSGGSRKGVDDQVYALGWAALRAAELTATPPEPDTEELVTMEDVFPGFTRTARLGAGRIR